MNTPTLRQFDFPADYPAVYALWQSAGAGIGLSLSDQPEELEKKVQRDPDLFLVAEVDGELVGSVIGGFDGRRGMIYHLAVADAYRRQGLASQLMAEVEARLRHKGCRKVYLLVKQGNDPALAFYERQGWAGMPTVQLLGKAL